eukprot:2999759-Rhodomonas_salina.2
MQHPPLRHAVAASGLVVAACAVLMVLAAMDGSIQQQQHAVVLKGMSGKSAQQDLDSYFDSMNQNVQKEQALAAQHLKRETSMLSKQEQDEELKTRGVATSKPAKHGLKAKVANAKLSGYFQKQALAIKQHEKQVAEERNENEPQALSTMAANKDLNSYFDSLNVATTKEGKLDLLAKQLSIQFFACATASLILAWNFPHPRTLTQNRQNSPASSFCLTCALCSPKLPLLSVLSPSDLRLLREQVSSLTKDFDEIAKPVKSLKQQQVEPFALLETDFGMAGN